MIGVSSLADAKASATAEGWEPKTARRGFAVIVSDAYVPSRMGEPLTVLYSDAFRGTTVIVSDRSGLGDAGLRPVLLKDELMKIAKNQTPTFVARISLPSGAIIDPAEITAIRYTISYKSYSPVGYVFSPIGGHNKKVLTKPAGSETFAELFDRPVADLFWEGIQTGAGWVDPEDAETDDTSHIRGYNFKHTPDTSSYPAFANDGEYQVQYTLTPTTGNPIVLSWNVTVS